MAVLSKLAHVAGIVGRGLLSTEFPILAHLIVTRRCNLSCAYCNEYDDHSDPVPLEMLRRRIAALGRLRTAIVTLSGGEPLLHPELPAVIRSIRDAGMSASMITNGFRLTREFIEALGAAGLQGLQISIDNVEPDAISKKSLKTLDRKLQLLARYADFPVNINSVLGISEERTGDAVMVARRAVELGFSSTVGVLHDGNGVLKPLGERQRGAYREIVAISGWPQRINYRLFQKNLLAGKPNSWKCRAGARYLYVCEDGLVHWCSQQRGYPAIPIEQYTVADLRREFHTRKGCAPHCTVSCVHQASLLDNWRPQQRIPDPTGTRHGSPELIQLGPPRQAEPKIANA
ncbi:MAG TPA: radical SAM protein [Gemmatimonadales bacterium]|jgi:MoaA/NifB/PqqE/SkfB family radical SAM enzyme|nr:radical SAM protein [Gemmatimonadales bacterium]